MKGCVPPGGVLCASLELLPSANLEWIMEEDKRCLPVAHGEGGTYGEVVLDVVAVDGDPFAGFLVNENGVLVGVEVVAGADPHFTYLCERGALGRAVGCFGEGDALAVGGGAVNGAILVDGDGNVFGAVGSADDVGRVGFHVDAHEHGVVDVAVLLELNDVCALEDAVDPHGRVEKDCLHGVFSCVGRLWWVTAVRTEKTCPRLKGRGCQIGRG